MTSRPWSRVIRLDGAVVRDPDPGSSVLDEDCWPCSNRRAWGLFRLTGWGFDFDEAFAWNKKVGGGN